MLMIIYLMITLISIMFFLMKHPLAMGLSLLIQTTLISMATGLINKSFWFSYILFLVFLGGMLVLFIYVTSLASNELFTLSAKMTLTLTILVMAAIMIMLNTEEIMFKMINTYSLETLPTMKTLNVEEENNNILQKLYNFPNNMITMMLINYLLITMLAIVNITSTLTGPLRPMNK